jgi:hypothetical protein
MPVNSNSKSLVFLQLVIAVFMIVLGIAGILPGADESVFTLFNGDLFMETVFGIAEIFCGIVLLLGFFDKISRGVVSVTTLVVFCFWAARIVLTKIIFGIRLIGGNITFVPNFFDWLLVLFAELTILLGILLVYQRNSNK